jgi:23S rRNA pseudouridine2605 synthase
VSSSPPKDTQRIAKLLARAGIASRREIERMIGEGRVAIDGKVIETPATLLASLHGVTVDGNAVRAAAPARLFRFHKPAGQLTTERDPKGRPTIYDRLPKDLPRVMPIGRLDMNTEGLLLLTTDGELKRQLELPATGIERTYRARAFGGISQEQLETLIEGIEIEGIRYGPIDANLERRTGRNQWIELRLREGKNREVRRVLEHLGLQISRLIRTAYGPFHLDDLTSGAVEEVRQHDLVAFRKDVTAPGMRPQPRTSRHAAQSTTHPAAQRRPSGPDGASSPQGRAQRRSQNKAGIAERSKPFATRGSKSEGNRPSRASEAKLGGGRASRTTSDSRRPSDRQARPRNPSSWAERPAREPQPRTGRGERPSREAGRLVDRPPESNKSSTRPQRGRNQVERSGAQSVPSRSQKGTPSRSTVGPGQGVARATIKASESATSRNSKRPGRPPGNGPRARHPRKRDFD